MDTTIRVDWHDAKVKQIALAAAMEGLMDAGHAIQAESQKIVPHKDGTLEGSATTEPVPGQTAVKVAYGGPASLYAARQHEEQMNHPNGRQWKYLETPLKRNAPKIPTLVGLKIRVALKG